MMRKIAAVSSALFVPSVASAHPGHEVLPIESQSSLHYLLEPAHVALPLAVGLVLLAVVFAALRWLQRRRRQVR